MAAINIENVIKTDQIRANDVSLIYKPDEQLTYTYSQNTMWETYILPNISNSIPSSYGFSNTETSILSYDLGSSTANIHPLSNSSFVVFNGGDSENFDTNANVVLEYGSNYIQYNSEFSLINSTDSFDLSNYTPVIFTYMNYNENVTANSILSFIDARESIKIPIETRKYLKDYIGTTVKSGFSAEYTLNRRSKITINSGILNNIDKDHDISRFKDSPFSQILKYYLSGRRWKTTQNDDIPFIIGGLATKPRYNKNQSSVEGEYYFEKSNVPNEDYFANFICVQPSSVNPIIIITGQNTYDTLSQCKNEALFSKLYGVDQFYDLKLLYRVIFYTDVTYTTDPNYTKIVHVDDYRWTTSYQDSIELPINHNDSQIYIELNDPNNESANIGTFWYNQTNENLFISNADSTWKQLEFENNNDTIVNTSNASTEVFDTGRLWYNNTEKVLWISNGDGTWNEIYAG